MLLSEMRDLTAGEVVTLCAGVATAVADLHDQGVVHGNVRPSNVEASEGRVRLGPPAENPLLTSAHDVRCVGELLLWLMARNGLTADAEVEALARRAAAAIPADRPSSRELADSLAVLTEPPRPHSAFDPPAATVRLRARWLAAAGATLFVAAAVAILLRDSQRPPPSALTPVPSSTIPAGAPRPSPAQVWPGGGTARRPCAERASGLAADLDGDGCAEPASVAGTSLRTSAGAVAVEGADLTTAVTGNWRCEGVTLAVLRHPAGEVYVFGGWAKRDREVVATPVATVPGALRLVAADRDGDGCDELRVVTTDGEEVALPGDVP